MISWDSLPGRWTLVFAPLSACAVATLAACGGGSSTTGGGTGGTTTVTSTSHTTVAAATGAGGASLGGCASSMNTPDPIGVNDLTPTQCTLADPAADANYFTFTGTKGEAIAIFTSAKPTMMSFDPTYLDTVVTLYDAQQNAIAQNDDPLPRDTNDAQLFTILPADGDYVIRVAECTLVFGASSCSPASMIVNTDYAINVVDVVPAAPSITFGTGSNGDVTKASPVKYDKDTTTQSYFLSMLYGLFDSATDVDVYGFTLPADVKTMAGSRSLANFYPFPSGKDGDGSTSSVGKMWIVDPADTTHHVAEIDASLGTTPVALTPPLTLGTPYYLFVSRPAGSSGTNDFYFISHFGGPSNPVEQHDTENGSAATAEALTNTMEADYLATYFVDGDIKPAGTDVDYYALAVPSGAKAISVICGAQRAGSGLRGFAMSLVASDGTTPVAANATITEDPASDAVLRNITLTNPGATVLLKLEAASQDPNVTSTFYRCAARFL